VVAVKIDIDRPQNATLTRRFGVSAIPAMHLVNSKGEPVAGILGDVSPAELLAEFEPHLK